MQLFELFNLLFFWSIRCANNKDCLASYWFPIGASKFSYNEALHFRSSVLESHDDAAQGIDFVLVILWLLRTVLFTFPTTWWCYTFSCGYYDPHPNLTFDIYLKNQVFGFLLLLLFCALTFCYHCWAGFKQKHPNRSLPHFQGAGPQHFYFLSTLSV